MLILSLRVGESVRVGDDISITVLKVKGSQVRLGVSAPKSIAVQREENSSQSKSDPTVKLGGQAVENEAFAS